MSRVPYLFWVIRQIIHTCMNSFGQQLPSQHQIKPEPKSGNHQMPPTLPLHHRKKKKKEKDSVRTHARTHGPACTRAGAAVVPHTKGAHAHTQKTAPCSLYLPSDADDRGCRWVQANWRREGACGCRDNGRPQTWERTIQAEINILRYEWGWNCNPSFILFHSTIWILRRIKLSK